MAHDGSTRYDHVQEILRNAAGDGKPSHGGAGAFWDLPRDEFVRLSIYGIALIPPGLADGGATPSEGHCCGTSGPSPGPPSGGASVKDAGLLKALRGQAPFDGTHFPRMPMGRPPVSDPDIAYIEQWIADGCPEQA